MKAYCKIIFIFCVLTAAGFGMAWGEYFPGMEKIIDSHLIDQASKSFDPVKVIVTLKGYEEAKNLDFQRDKSGLIAYQSKVFRLQDNVLRQMTSSDGRAGLRLANAPVFGASLYMNGLKSLAGHDDVAFIEEDREMELHTAQGIPLMAPGKYRSAHSGRNVSVAIVDTGVNYNHPVLGGGGFPNRKVIGGYDFGDKDGDPMDKQGHGSSCAGISAGMMSISGDYRGGVAPGAGVYALKVRSRSGEIRNSAILASIDWCISHRNDDSSRPIKVISMSLGTPEYHSDDYCNNTSRSAQTVVRMATRNGIAIFVSSGNEAQRRGISFTSCMRDTISVGAVYDGSIGKARFSNCRDNFTRADLVTCYSNSSRILDILAPSHASYTAATPGRKYAARFGGTSAACPYAAGAAALIQSYHKEKTGRFMDVNRLRQILINTGDSVRDPKSGIEKPRVNIAAAIASLGLGEGRDRDDGNSGMPLDDLEKILRDADRQ